MSETNSRPPYMTVLDAKAYLAEMGITISRRSIEIMLARGVISARKVLGRIFVERASLDSFLADLPRAQLKLPQPRRPPDVVPDAPPPTAAAEPQAAPAPRPRRGRPPASASAGARA